MSIRALPIVAVTAFCLSSAAQQTPHLGYLYPAGGRQGSTFQVIAGGQRLVQPTNAFISGSGVEAKVIEYTRPMGQKEFNDLREEHRNLQEKRHAAGRRSASPTNTWSSADERKFIELRNRLLKNPPNRDGNPAIAEKVIVQVTISSNAAAGDRELRVFTVGGLSNPLKFCVDALPEFTTPAASAPNPEIERFKRLLGVETNAALVRAEQRIAIPAVINGQIMPGQADRFRFSARNGQDVVASVKARALVPYIADAVPGWFQAALTLYDAKGRELAYNDDWRFDPDPLLHCVIPKDGEYILEIKDAIYRGREDFVYRITVGELPFLTDLFPLGGRAGEDVRVEQTGFNLSTRSRVFTLPAKPTDSITVEQENGAASRLFPLAVDSLSECVEVEPNDSVGNAQALELPIIINGRISKRGDVDIFRFEGRAGQEIVAEVNARRLGSPLDSILKITDREGHLLGSNDDYDDKLSGLETHHADSYLRVKLPRDGVYFVELTDVEGDGGKEFAYRLRLSEPQPDFALRVTPSSVMSRGGLPVAVTVNVIRKDGFTNAIELSAKPDSGFIVQGGRLEPGQDKVRVTIAPATRLANTCSNVPLEGRALVEGKEIVRPAVPADDMMQAFFYHHLVPAQELVVASANNQWNVGARLRLVTKSPVQVTPGGTTKIQFTVPPGLGTDRFEFQLSEAPEGVSLGAPTREQETLEFVIRCDSKKAKTGLKDNLVINVFGGRTQGGKKNPQAGQRLVLGVLPAVPIEVIPKTPVPLAADARQF